jgi:hypothetical protein
VTPGPADTVPTGAPHDRRFFRSICRKATPIMKPFLRSPGDGGPGPVVFKLRPVSDRCQHHGYADLLRRGRNGTRLPRPREQGEGVPLVCLPGGPMRASAYLGDLGGLAGNLQLIMLLLSIRSPVPAPYSPQPPQPTAPGLRLTNLFSHLGRVFRTYCGKLCPNKGWRSRGRYSWAGSGQRGSSGAAPAAEPGA